LIIQPDLRPWFEVMSSGCTSRRILLIEDDAELSEAIRDIFVECGHTVVEATDGGEGLQRMREFKPDVVVLDLMMPRFDGWKFRVEQRRDPDLATTPLVVLSASNSPTAAAVDADLYLHKPIDATVLVEALEGVVNARERQRGAEKLAQTERLAAMGTLAAGLAHEINNPLQCLMLEIDTSKRAIANFPASPQRDTLVERLASASEAAERIREITSAVRLFAHPDNIQTGLLDIRSPIAAALRLAAPLIRHRATVRTALGELTLVTANEGALAQVFLNLLTNAAQAIKEGAPEHNEISVLVDLDAERVRITVTDTGVGIPPALLGRIFEPFFTTKPVGQGMGLGLSISHDIVRSFGGTIRASNATGGGTSICVSLPCVAD
jgi:C4-dicarboxylate-specific signal transduction histidine kinase